RHRPAHPWRRPLAMNLPILFVVVALLVKRYLDSTPEKNFERMVAKPIPASVHDVQQAGTRRMDGELWLLRFKIAAVDTEKLLKVMEATVVEGRSLDSLQRSIRGDSGWDVALNEGWRVYEAPPRMMVVSPDRQSAIFILDVH